MVRRKSLVLIIGFFICLITAGCSKTGNVIGEVNGDKITRAQFEQRYKIIKFAYESSLGAKLDEKKDQEITNKLEDRAFNDLIIQKLIQQEAEKQSVKVTKEDVDSSFTDFKQSRNQQIESGYDKFLQDSGLDEKELRTVIESELLYQQMEDKVAADVSVTDEQAQQYYNQNKSSFTDPGGIEIYHILVNTKSEALDILSNLKQGADFSQLAQQYSTCPSKEKGGDLGVVNESSNFVPEFKAAALNLKPGEITAEPVKTQFGYHIIKAGNKKAATVKSFSEVKDQIMLQLKKDQKEKVFNDYLANLKKKAEIKDYREK